MERMNIIHGENKRIVIITLCKSTNDNPIIYTNFDKDYAFICKQFRDCSFNYFNSSEGIKSIDNTSLLYSNGFKDAVFNHSEEIIDFFSHSKNR